MRKDEALAAIKTSGLGRIAPDVQSLMTESIRLKSRPVNEQSLAVGASKIGGLPDLPPGIDWPTWKGLPLAFVVQLNLPEVSRYDTNKLLPSTGTLYFFYDAQQQAFGSEPADRGGWKVIHYNGDLTRLTRQSAPPKLPDHARFTACAVDFFTDSTLPQRPVMVNERLKWSDADQHAYASFLTSLPDSADRAAIHHRLLGYPDEIQDDMHLQVQLVSHGLHNPNDPGAAALMKGAYNWQLLLQLDSDENAGMRWANNGMVYYWIEREALRTRNFEQVWAVLQSE